MKFAVASLLALTGFASATPFRRGIPSNDTQILNYALTLEHLEATFYKDALAKFSTSAFTKAGYPAWVRGRFLEIASQEAQHVALLTGALGADANAACTYTFPYTDVKSFISLASVIEGVGVSAYLGAAGYIQEKAYLTVAGSILTTEARHQAWMNSAANHYQPWSGPEDTPLSLSQVYNIAAPFIKSCPSTNEPLPVQVYGTLGASPANAPSGTKVTFTFSGNGTSYYALFYSGLTATAVQLDSKKSATVPKGIEGTYYTVITTAADGNATDTNTVAGPSIAVVNFAAGKGITPSS